MRHKGHSKRLWRPWRGFIPARAAGGSRFTVCTAAPIYSGRGPRGVWVTWRWRLSKSMRRAHSPSPSRWHFRAAPEKLRKENRAAWLALAVYARVLEKLQREPVEDYRIDFEDGYGNRSDAEA